MHIITIHTIYNLTFVTVMMLYMYILELLKVVGGLAVLGGNILFSENSHNPEGFSGALHLSSFGQIKLQRGTNITFTNNSGM